MPSSKLKAAFDEWLNTAPKAEVSLLLDTAENAADLSITFFGIQLQFFVQAAHPDDDKRFELFVQGPEEDEYDGDSQTVLVDTWLADVNAFITERAVQLSEVLDFMVRTFPRLNLVDTLHSQQLESCRNGDENDSDSDWDEIDMGKRWFSTGDDNVSFTTWCHQRHLPPGCITLHRRFYSPLPSHVWEESRVLQEACAAKAQLSALKVKGVAMTCISDMGLIQYAVDPISGLCHGDFNLACQLGLNCEEPLTIAIVLADDAISATDWRSLPWDTFAVVELLHDKVRTGREQASFATTELLPKLIEAFMRCQLSTSEQFATNVTTSIDFSDEPHGNLFLDLWWAIEHFMDTATSFCPVCLQKHGIPSIAGRLFSCDQEFCIFRYEEFLLSLQAEIQRAPATVELHLTLASAAAKGSGDLFEPFPARFLQTTELRSRAGFFDNRSKQTSAHNKDMSAVRAALHKLPRVEVLQNARSDEQLRLLLSGPNHGDGDAGGSAAYAIAQFVVGTSRMILDRVDNTQWRLPKLHSSTVQLAVVQHSPLVEQPFVEQKRLHGSSFAFHGSPLGNWYSIMRNGLRVLSHTELMTSGASYGAAVYLAEKMDTAVFYCRGYHGSRYPCSFGDALQVVGIIEYINDPACCRHHHEGILTVKDASATLLRYILLRNESSIPSAEGFAASDVSSLNIRDLEVASRYTSLMDNVKHRTADLKRSCNPRVDLGFIDSDTR